MDVRAAQVLVRDLFAGRRLDQRRAADEDRPLAADDDRLVAHGRDVGAAGRARAHHDRDLGDPERGEPGLVVEDPAEVLLVGERPRLVGQEDPARIDEIDAREAVLEGDLLGAEVLLDGHREVGPALDRGVVGHDQHLAAVDDADAGDHAGGRGLVVVHAVRGQGAELEERACCGRRASRGARGRGAFCATCGARGISAGRPPGPWPGAPGTRPPPGSCARRWRGTPGPGCRPWIRFGTCCPSRSILSRPDGRRELIPERTYSRNR